MAASSQEIRRGAVYVLHVEALMQQKNPAFLNPPVKLSLTFIFQGRELGEGICELSKAQSPQDCGAAQQGQENGGLSPHLWCLP